MEVQSIIINGYPKSGKDLFTEYCQLATPEGVTVRHISTVDNVKKAFTLLGWDGVKNNNHRDFLSFLKVESIKHFDGPYRYICKTIKELEQLTFASKCVVFIDCREPEEIQRFKDDLGALTLFISRTPEDLPMNDSDNRVEDYVYDVVINNHGTLEELAKKARMFMYNRL
ncbi:MAG: hypothetical protein M0P49_00765 [Bacilli bacterium]|jgi:hypothetical protein|nr:hypothetical protein [Bacilli bacterium]